MSYVLLAALLAAFIFDSESAKNATFSKESSTIAKGIGACLVFVHHIAMNSSGGFLTQMNFPAVSVFFLLAGYGMMYGLVNKTNYSKKIIKEKIPLILKWSALSILMVCIFWAAAGDSVSWEELLCCVTGNRVLCWFFPALCIHYVIFALVAKCCKDDHKKCLVVLWNVTIMYMVAARVFIQIGSWYSSSLAFPTGATLYYWYNRKPEKFKRLKVNGYRYKMLTLLTVLFVCTFIGVYFPTDSLVNRLIHLGFQLASAEIFAVMVFTVCIGRKSKGLLAYIGNHSAEMLYIQGITLNVFRNKLIYLNNDFLYGGLTTVAQALLLIAVVPMYKWVGNFRVKNKE